MRLLSLPGIVPELAGKPYCCFTEKERNDGTVVVIMLFGRATLKETTSIRLRSQ